MPEWVRAYPQLVRAALQVTLTYRARLLFMFTGALFPMLLLFVWLTVAAGGPTHASWTTGRFVSYYVAAAVVHDLTSSDISWAWDSDLRSGDFAAKLLRPVPVFHQYAAAAAGSRIVTAAILGPLLVVLAIVLPVVAFPAGAASLLAAVAATGLAFLLAVLMSSTFALIGFWTTQSGNVYLLWWGLGAFVSGWIAPIALMPLWLQRSAELLPFRYALGFPVEIALGIPAGSTLTGFIVAFFWLAVFAGLYPLLWRNGVRRYQAVGG